MNLLHHKKFTNLQIVGDLSASTTCRRQLLGCCDQLAEGVARYETLELGSLFSEESPVPDRVQLQTLVPIEGGVIPADVGWPQLQPTDHNIPVTNDDRWYLPKDLLQFGG